MIVLPEAFNYGRNYAYAVNDTDKEPTFSKADTLTELSGISADWAVRFVVGLLDSQYGGIRRSSAYLIRNAVEPTLMHYKQRSDSSKTYEPCTFNCDASNPVEHDGVRIGALICNEAESFAAGTFDGHLAKALEATGSARTLICIPACLDANMFSDSKLTSRPWIGKYVVLANSKPAPQGCRSFITNIKGEKQWPKGLPPNLVSNSIIMKSWVELDK